MLEQFNYNGNNVSFLVENDIVMVNATQMAKPFDKRPNDYLSLPSVNELIKAITRKSGIAENQVVKTIRGGLNPGTWLNEDLAIDFAQWLSVDFKLWVSDRIKELMKYGFTADNKTLDALVSNPDLLISLATQLKREREEKDVLKRENERMKPRDKFVNIVFDSSSLLTLSQAAKALQLPYGRNKMCQKLREKGVFMKRGTEPKQIYVNNGYFVVKEASFVNATNTYLRPQTFVSQKGLGFIARTLGVIEVPKLLQ
ncbi:MULTISPECIES: KilA-N domain-containing protein [Elizabethkingia]|uniref:KilA-N domain-containing protein n=1 Tax=Elizabethkingia TaxID=308865 RepID=UPI001629A482|nr:MULTISPECIES: KilA-N domain-containing protein [Elizabethkingia]